MVETVGAAILAGVELAGVTGPAGFALGSTTIAGVGLATAVGTTAVIGASIGLQYALRNTDVPKPENGSQAIKQAIPPRLMGYWDNRLAGYYMLYEASGDTSYDVIAFHHGIVESVSQIYLHDDAVATVPDATFDTALVVSATGDGWYGASRVSVVIKNGAATQTAIGGLSAVGWGSTFNGNGVAHAALICGAPGDPGEYSTIFPHGKPELSLVARCTPIWDPRDPAQDENDSSTWLASPNPVLQLIDYLTRVDGGMGHDRETILPDAVLDLWMVEADLCDEDSRYRSAGWFLFDTDPEQVINKILACCDGWLAEAGDGTLSLTVGVYREPTEAAITDSHIFGFSINHGIADEQVINQIDATYTSPADKYVTVPIDPVRNEVSIAASQVRPQSLDLSWVQSATQAESLAQRAMQRLNPSKTGTIVTNLYGLQYLGKRWVNLHYSRVARLSDCVIEIQKATVNITAGRVSFDFVVVFDSAFANASVSQYIALFEDI